MMLAAIMGSATAQIAMMSRTMVPEMEKAGYSRPFSAATTAAAGLIRTDYSAKYDVYYLRGRFRYIDWEHVYCRCYSWYFIRTFLYDHYCIYWYESTMASKQNAPVKEMLDHLFKVIPALLVPVVIIVGILSGIFTATESAAIASVVALIVGIFCLP